MKFIGFKHFIYVPALIRIFFQFTGALFCFNTFYIFFFRLQLIFIDNFSCAFSTCFRQFSFIFRSAFSFLCITLFRKSHTHFRTQICAVFALLHSKVQFLVITRSLSFTLPLLLKRAHNFLYTFSTRFLCMYIREFPHLKTLLPAS